MNNLVKFIDTDYLKRNTSIEENVDDDKLIPYIYKSQDTHLQQILGSTFYEHLKQQFIDDDLSVDEDTLIRDYIQRTVSEWTYYEVYPSLNFKPTNKAISKENSNYSSSSELNEIKYMRNDIRNLAEFYSARLLKFLDQNCHLFPVYQNSCNENLDKNNKPYFSGVFIPD